MTTRTLPEQILALELPEPNGTIDINNNVIKRFYTEDQLVLLLAAAADIAASLPGAKVPEGWGIERHGDTITVMHMAIGRAVVPCGAQDPSDVVLYHLAEALLAATPAAPVAEPSVTPEMQATVDEIAATAQRTSERLANLRKKYGIAAQPQPVAKEKE